MDTMCELCGEDRAVWVLGMSCRPRALCTLCALALAPARVPVPVPMAVAA